MSDSGSNEGLNVRLRDGRTVCYAQYGVPDGFPIVNAHGGLACRLDVAAADASAKDKGIRLISPDRPGIGGSDPKAGRTILDWADDVAELLDLLSVDRFAVMGWSMGGQYAAAVGRALAPRVTRVAIIAGALPLTEPGVFARLPTFDRVYTRLSQRAPWAARLCFRSMGFAAGVVPSWYGRLAADGLGAADGKVIRDEGVRVFARMSAEAMRQPGGVAEDYRAWMRPWGFAPEDLAVPVEVWAGEQDDLVSTEWEIELARRIPGASLQLRPGGHFLAHLYYGEIFENLTQ
jgi:pimeloyl-ACP methyl ester carboxylesterase